MKNTHETAAQAPSVDRRITAADEYYRHQIVEPQILTEAPRATWAERCYHSVYLAPGLMMNFGRAVYPYAGIRRAFFACSTGHAQHAVRALDDFVLGRDDPDEPQVGDVRIELIEPLKRIRVLVGKGGDPLQADFVFEARGLAIPTDRNKIEVGGELVTDYMNFYQSGYYTGEVKIEGETKSFSRVPGFRDRGWGFRKHEGAPRRGFVLFSPLEFETETLYVLVYEKATGERIFTNGWLVGEHSVTDKVVDLEHDLAVTDGLVTGGALHLGFASGRRSTVEFTVNARQFLAAGGYAPNQSSSIGYRRYDLNDPAVVAELDGQNDNGCIAWMDGQRGQGFVETGIGVHSRYKPG